MRLRYTGIRPGVVVGEPVWLPGDERDVADDDPRAGTPHWERARSRPAPAHDDTSDDTSTTKARRGRAMEAR